MWMHRTIVVNCIFLASLAFANSVASVLLVLVALNDAAAALNMVHLVEAESAPAAADLEGVLL